MRGIGKFGAARDVPATIEPTTAGVRGFTGVCAFSDRL